MKFRILIGLVCCCLLMTVVSTQATPLRLEVQPIGTNQVKLTFGPVIHDCLYRIMVRTNSPEGHWMTCSPLLVGRNNPTITETYTLGGRGDLNGLTMQTLKDWTFVAGYWDDSDKDGLPDLYEDLVTRTDPYSGDEGYSDLDGDGWNNLEEMQNNTDPLRADLPAQPRFWVRFYSTSKSGRSGKAVITIQNLTHVLPDYILLERANRTLRPPSQDRRYPRPSGFNRGQYGRREDPFITGPFKPLARIPTRPNVQEYTYVDTNVDTFFQPRYRMKAHFTPPFRAFLDHVDATTIRHTLLKVQSHPTSDGYELTVFDPIPYGRYLLLVRDRQNPQWRASGYFTGGSNRAPVHVQVNPEGMMTTGQSPIAMPEVKFLPKVVDPQFTAGWGEDSDGDGLPDIYEVLVTKTDPVNSDTGHTGVLDGYKEMTGDGWSNLEKFRRRANPLIAAQPPHPVILRQPTMREVMHALAPQTDLRYKPQVEVRLAGTSSFQEVHQPLWMRYRMSNPRNPYNVRGNFDVRISWVVPQPQPHVYGNGP